MDFLWHKVSEKEKKEIEKQAKNIIDNFSKKLSRIKEVKESFIERKKGEREEGGKPNEVDRKIMFRNAPEKNKDFIIAERREW